MTPHEVAHPTTPRVRPRTRARDRCYAHQKPAMPRRATSITAITTIDNGGRVGLEPGIEAIEWLLCSIAAISDSGTLPGIAIPCALWRLGRPHPHSQSRVGEVRTPVRVPHYAEDQAGRGPGRASGRDWLGQGEFRATPGHGGSPTPIRQRVGRNHPHKVRRQRTSQCQHGGKTRGKDCHGHRTCRVHHRWFP